jgi:hypothetical protein
MSKLAEVEKQDRAERITFQANLTSDVRSMLAEFSKARRDMARKAMEMRKALLLDIRQQVTDLRKLTDVPQVAAGRPVAVKPVAAPRKIKVVKIPVVRQVVVPEVKVVKFPAAPKPEAPKAKAFEPPAAPKPEVPKAKAVEPPAAPKPEAPRVKAFEPPASPKPEVPKVRAFEPPAAPKVEVPKAKASVPVVPGLKNKVGKSQPREKFGKAGAKAKRGKKW